MKLFSQLLVLAIIAQCILCIDCPHDWPLDEQTDDQISCKMPTNYPRGAGYPIEFGEFNLKGAKKRCQKAHPAGCEQWGLIMYPKCKKGFHNSACCICEPSCPWIKVIDLFGQDYCVKNL